MNKNILITTFILALLSLSPVIGLACGDDYAELSTIGVKGCNGNGEILLYQGDQTQDPQTRFYVPIHRDQLLIFTRGDYVSSLYIKENDSAVTPEVVFESTSPFSVKIYAINTSYGSEIKVYPDSSDARGIQAYLFQNKTNPVIDVSTIQIVYDGNQQNQMYLLPGLYEYMVFDKYTEYDNGHTDSRALNVVINGSEGVVYNQTFTTPLPEGTQGAVVDSFIVEGGSYLFSIDTQDSVYWPLFSCPEYECYTNNDCQPTCDGSVSYTGGTCQAGTCVYESQNCSDLPTEEECTLSYENTILTQNASHYVCSLEGCVKEYYSPYNYICDFHTELKVEECGGQDYYCYYNGTNYTWGDSFPDNETNCTDGHDNDNDGLTDGDDCDCYSCFYDVDCDDFNTCTEDNCVLGVCTNDILQDGTSCDDGNQTTINDACYVGVCVGETDNDDDGYGDDDCDDSDSQVNPGSDEICGDGIDNDCDGLTDYDDEDCFECTVDEDCEGDLSCVDGICEYPDEDDDGFNSNEDCDDNDSAINPDAAELCEDGIDNDCDGLVDCDDDYCSLHAACQPAPSGGGGGFVPTASTGPTTVCGNDKCEYKENCDNCPEDCMKPGEVCCNNVTFGGNCCNDNDCVTGQECIDKTCIYVKSGIADSDCLENWTCSDWSECINSTQTRTCTDLNECGTVFNKTAEAQDCEVAPITGLFTFVTTPTFGVIGAAMILFLILLLWRRKK